MVNTRQATFLRVMHDVLELENTDYLMTALEEAGINTMPLLLGMKESDIDNLSASTEEGQPKLVPLSQRNYVKVLKSWNKYIQETRGATSVDWT